MMIELLVIIGILVVFLFGSLLLFITKRIKLWRYKPENDKGRCAEESRRRELAVVQRPVLSVVGQKSNILPATESIPTRQDSTGNRKLRFFRRK